MKKTILAIAVTGLFATTAQAAQIYENADITVNMFGDAEVAIIKSLDKHDDTEISIDEANLGFQVDYAFNADVTLSGLVKFGAADGDATLSDAWVGASSQKLGTLTIGNQATIYDDAGIGADYQFGFTSFYSQENSGEQVIKYKLDKESFYVGLAYLVNDESGQTDGTKGFDGNIGVRAGDFEATVYFADMTDESGATDYDKSNVNLELRYQLDALALAAAYAVTDEDKGDVDTFGLAATYDVSEKVTVAGGWASIDSDMNTDLDNQFYLNTSYAFNDYFVAYAEVGANDADDSELGYALGITAEF